MAALPQHSAIDLPPAMAGAARLSLVERPVDPAPAQPVHEPAAAHLRELLSAVSDGSLELDTVAALHRSWARIAALATEADQRERAWRRTSFWMFTPAREEKTLPRPRSGALASAPVPGAALAVPEPARPVSFATPDPAFSAPAGQPRGPVGMQRWGFDVIAWTRDEVGAAFAEGDYDVI